MMMLESLQNAPGRLEQRGARWLMSVGRLRDGVTVEQAQADFDNVTAGLEEMFPSINENRGAQVRGLRQALIGNAGQFTSIVFTAVGCLLLIACINVVNILLSRALVRGGELNLRLAVGAGRSRIIQQFLTEGAILAFLGTAVGWLVAYGGVQVLVTLLPAGVLPTFMQIELNSTALLFSTVVMALTALVVGIVPALYAIRNSTSGALGSGSRGGGQTRSRVRLQHGLVIAQVAIAVPLLIGAGLMTRSLAEQLAIDTGVDVDRVAAFRIQLPAERYTQETIPVFVDQLETELAAIPGVSGVAVGTDLPLRRSSAASFIFLEGQTEPEDRIRYYRHFVSMDYFDALGVDLIEGRTFQRSDLDVPEDEGGYILIGEALARRHFPVITNMYI